jgi:hypothetical protein
VQQRNVTCTRSDGLPSPCSSCPAEAGAAPSANRTCAETAACAAVVYSWVSTPAEFTACAAQCGQAQTMQTRSVICMGSDGNAATNASDSCGVAAPASSRTCTATSACPTNCPCQTCVDAGTSLTSCVAWGLNCSCYVAPAPCLCDDCVYLTDGRVRTVGFCTGLGIDCSCYVPEACTAQPCLNGGACTTLGAAPGRAGRFQCACSGGYSGTRCEVPPACLSSPCQHLGVCSDALVVNASVNGSLYSGPVFSCRCVDGWGGQTCETSPPCWAAPCMHNASCANVYRVVAAAAAAAAAAAREPEAVCTCAGESFMRVHWVAVSKELRARRINRRQERHSLRDPAGVQQLSLPAQRAVQQLVRCRGAPGVHVCLRSGRRLGRRGLRAAPGLCNT